MYLKVQEINIKILQICYRVDDAVYKIGKLIL